MIRFIKTVAVYVTDQTQSLEFFMQKLGFDLRTTVPMAPGANWIEVAPPGAQTHIVIYPRSMMPNWETMKSSIMFQCDDVETTFADLSSRGVTFTQPPTKMHWGTFAKFTDPDGNEYLLTKSSDSSSTY